MITQAPPKETRQKKPPASVDDVAAQDDESERRALVERMGMDYIEFMRLMRALSSVRAKQR